MALASRIGGANAHQQYKLKLYTEATPASRHRGARRSGYLTPVNADNADVEIIIVPEADGRVNPAGVKGIGEIGITGMNAAVANAVFHATGNLSVTCRSGRRSCFRSRRPMKRSRCTENF